MTPQIKAGIIATANALGMDPLDLATIISYETAGTFDPLQPGPTTKWGRHRGLIQFGEPQAQKFGVDFSSPQAALESQFGPDGAIARYYRAHGWQPGMSMLDAYSIVNAGAPGRYDASDAAAGGAPGTVRDKVEKQMDEHRRKAMALLGGQIDFPMPAPASAQPSPDQPFGTMAPQPVPAAVGRYAVSPEPVSIGDRLAALGEAFAPPPPPPVPRPGPMPDARATGGALLGFLNSPTVADLLVKRRLAGIA